MDLAPVDVGILTVIPAELEAARLALGLPLSARHKEQDGTVYHHGTIHSRLTARDYSLVLGCVGFSGNYDSATSTTALLKDYCPTAVFLVGIAAGIRGKVKIGDAVLSDRVVAFEPGAAVRAPGGDSALQPRPEMTRVPHAMRQDVVNYRYDAARLSASLASTGVPVPTPPPGEEDAYCKHVATQLSVRDATIASGELLLRDPSKLLVLRETMHGKIEVGEMEAVGFVNACSRVPELRWLVIRGISDFGDELKNDAFQPFAAGVAAAALADFLAYGLELPPHPATRHRLPRDTTPPARPSAVSARRLFDLATDGCPMRTGVSPEEKGRT